MNKNELEEEICRLKDLISDTYYILEYAEVTDGFARDWARRTLEEDWIHEWDRYPGL